MPNKFMRFDNNLLIGEPLKKEGATNPLLKFGSNNQVPRFTIYKNDGGTYPRFQDGIINLDIDYNSFVIFSELFLTMLEKESPKDVVCPMMVNAEDENGRYIKGEMVKNGALIFGKKKSGRPFLAYDDKVGQHFEFNFLPPRRMGFFTDGMEMPKEYLAVKYAKGWMKGLIDLNNQSQMVKTIDANLKNRKSY